MQTGLTFDDVLLRPKKSLRSRSEVSLVSFMDGSLSLKLPIVSSNMDTITEWKMAATMFRQGGFSIVHRFMDVEEQIIQMKKVWDETCYAGAAVGVNDNERILGLINNDPGHGVYCIDIANGYSDAVAETIQFIKKNESCCVVIAGNVATAEGAKFLVDAGADIIKAGIGPGGLCSTRVVTGCGMPQLTAIQECCSVADYVIADGGIRTSGDIVKALAAGADLVMLGSLLAGTDETPGEIYQIKGKCPITGAWGQRYKRYRGMASREAQSLWKEAGEGKNTSVEGEATDVPCRGPVADILVDLAKGVKSGMSYIGATNLMELRHNAEFIRITEAGYKESIPHKLS